MSRGVSLVISLVIATVSAVGCQRPTDPDDVIEYDEVVDVSASPDPIEADTSTGGKTYRIVRGNNQPDEIVPYDWHAVFSTTVSFNDQAVDEDIDVDFPVRISAATLTVKQASGGIVTPPTGGETEKYEFRTLNASGNEFAQTNSPINLTFEVWYDLPSLRKEAVVTLAYSFVDEDGTAFQKTEDVQVAP
jgi:hypothetical protein